MIVMHSCPTAPSACAVVVAPAPSVATMPAAATLPAPSSTLRRSTFNSCSSFMRLSLFACERGKRYGGLLDHGRGACTTYDSMRQPRVEQVVIEHPIVQCRAEQRVRNR